MCIYMDQYLSEICKLSVYFSRNKMKCRSGGCCSLMKKETKDCNLTCKICMLPARNMEIDIRCSC
jgi:hypothetical protein